MAPAQGLAARRGRAFCQGNLTAIGAVCVGCRRSALCLVDGWLVVVVVAQESESEVVGAQRAAEERVEVHDVQVAQVAGERVEVLGQRQRGQ